MLEALEIAKEERDAGAREVGKNNAGEFVYKYHGRILEAAWCAAFVSWCCEEAARRSGMQMPFKRSGSAKRLFSNIVAAGMKSDTPKTGDIVCWHRGNPKHWTGHIGFVTEVSDRNFKALEGNVGAYWKTKGRVREIDHELADARLIGFARLRKDE